MCSSQWLDTCPPSRWVWTMWRGQEGGAGTSDHSKHFLKLYTLNSVFRNHSAPLSALSVPLSAAFARRASPQFSIPSAHSPHVQYHSCSAGSWTASGSTFCTALWSGHGGRSPSRLRAVLPGPFLGPEHGHALVHRSYSTIFKKLSYLESCKYLQNYTL